MFEAATKAGWLVAPARAEHVAFGSVLGADKKIMRTRAVVMRKVINPTAHRPEKLAVSAFERAEVRQKTEVPLAGQCGVITGIAQDRR